MRMRMERERTEGKAADCCSRVAERTACSVQHHEEEDTHTVRVGEKC